MMPITQTGYQRLKERIAQTKKDYETMPAIIGKARELGDLKENAEYHAARERQGMLKAEMDKLNSDLTQAQIVDPASLPKDKVTFGKKVELEDLESGAKVVYSIVGPAESDSETKSISVTSQLAKGLLTKSVGQEAVVEVPAGSKRYKILNIELV